MAILFKSSTGKAVLSAPEVELMPGDVAVADTGDQLKTLLGSCVCVVLTDPRRSVAAMCHIVHVGTPNAANAHNSAFGTVAMRGMYAHLRAKGVNPAQCHAYVFGGGNMFPQFDNPQHVGANNVNWVLNFLSDEGIPVIDHSVGGHGYRKVVWTVGLAEPRVENVVAQQGVPS